MAETEYLLQRVSVEPATLYVANHGLLQVWVATAARLIRCSFGKRHPPTNFLTAPNCGEGSMHMGSAQMPLIRVWVYNVGDLKNVTKGVAVRAMYAPWHDAYSGANLGVSVPGPACARLLAVPTRMAPGCRLAMRFHLVRGPRRGCWQASCFSGGFAISHDVRATFQTAFVSTRINHCFFAAFRIVLWDQSILRDTFFLLSPPNLILPPRSRSRCCGLGCGRGPQAQMRQSRLIHLLSNGLTGFPEHVNVVHEFVLSGILALFWFGSGSFLPPPCFCSLSVAWP